eukprot:3206014-Prymnesium_polylepis.1
MTTTRRPASMVARTLCHTRARAPSRLSSSTRSTLCRHGRDDHRGSQTLSSGRFQAQSVVPCHKALMATRGTQSRRWAWTSVPPHGC